MDCCQEIYQICQTNRDGGISRVKKCDNIFINLFEFSTIVVRHIRRLGTRASRDKLGIIEFFYEYFLLAYIFKAGEWKGRVFLYKVDSFV